MAFAVSQGCGSDPAAGSPANNDAGAADGGGADGPVSDAPAPPAPDGPVSDAPAPDAPPTGATITGKVAGISNSPVPGAKVLIQGKVATTTPTGTFTITGVSVPYDVTVIMETGAIQPANAPLINTVVGLTGTSPLISVIAFVPISKATVAGTLSGGAGFPNGVGASYSVYASGPSVGGGVGSGGGQAQDGSYQVEPRWPADQATQTLGIYALQFIPSTGMPTSFPGFGSATAFSTPNGAALTNQIIILSAAATSVVEGTIVAPSGYTVQRRTLHAAPGVGGFFSWSELSADTAFSLTAPNLGIGSLEVSASATSGTGEFSSAAVRKIAPAGATGMTITLPAAPLQTAPAANATGANPTTPFSWTASTTAACSIYSVELTSSVTNSPQYRLITAATTVRFPDLSAQGLTPPAGGAYQWHVSCSGPFANIDGAVGVAGLREADSASSPQSAFLMQ